MGGMTGGAVCTICGQPITGEAPEGSGPCEFCSSPSGGFPHFVPLTEEIAGSAAGFVEGATYPRILLRMAKFLLGRHDDKLCGLVTILAHLSCDLAVERSFSDALARKGIRQLEDPMADVLNGFSLANEKVRNLYTSLTGLALRDQPFWDGFLRSTKRRDNIIRDGLIVGRADAEESVKAAEDFLDFLES